MSYRQTNGSRLNQWGHPIDSGATITEEGGVVRSKGKRPSHKFMSMTSRGADGKRKIAVGRKMADLIDENGAEAKVAAALENGLKPGSKLHTKNNGNGMRVQCYDAPVLANPGNIIKCIVGVGVMGSKLAHENEAPFPEKLAEFFIRSFCPAGGTVLDCFCGSGTTLAVGSRIGRNAIGIDVRQSQADLSKRRVAAGQKELFT